MKENYGNLESLKELGKNKANSFTTEQLLDENLKNLEGENRIEVTARMNRAFNRIISENTDKRIAIVSHGAAIKFLLMKWCKLNNDNQLEYDSKIIKLNSPGVIKLLIKNKEVKKVEQIV